MSATPEPGASASATDLDGTGDHSGTYHPETAGRIAAVAFTGLLFFPVKDLFDSHLSAIRLGLTLAGVAAFFVIFVWRLVFAAMGPKPTRATWLWLAVASVLAVTLVLGDDPKRWAPLFIFVSAVIGVRVGLPWAAYGIAACTVLSAAVLAPIAPFENTAAVALQALAVGALTSGMGRLRDTINELHEAREQLARLAVTEERLRFSRDLHDLLGHSLSVIALKADFAGRLLPAQADRAAKEVADIDTVARRALAEVRDAVSGYRQPTVAEAVAAGRQALDAAGIDTTCDVAQVALPADLDAVLAWALREGVTNVIRHSQARHCSIQVTAGLVEAAAEIIDDGVGHPPELSNGSATGPHDDRPIPDWAGNGLAGLAERVAALHGRLEVAPLPQGGFRLKASVPTAAALAESTR